MGEAGPFDMYDQAILKWNDYVDWCVAMDVN